ncbi:MAG: acyltransferase family protein [Clostridia bacterium]|nr:acyltransferase family protein [Clostridia bacterium]
MSPTPIKRIDYITFIQTVAAFSVVELHTNGCFWWDSNASYWLASNFQECLFYFAVPLFFMVTGITLIDYPERYSLGGYFKKRLLRAGVPFLLWSVIGLAYRLLTHTIPLTELSDGSAFLRILNNDVIGIYWFFTPLFGVYLCLPLLAAVPKEKRTRLFTYLFLAGLTLNVLLPFLRATLTDRVNIPLQIDVASGYLLYIIGGVLLHEHPLKGWRLALIYAAGAIGFAAHFVGTWLLSREAGQIVTTFKEYTNLPCVLYSFAVFCLLRQIGERVMKTKAAAPFRAVSGASFSIYLMHWFVLDLLLNHTAFLGWSIDPTSPVYRWLAPFAVVPLILGVVWLIRKIPVVKHIAP